ncbi:hypothetical protein [Massilia eburnea]|uniref:hypothetical protein n=1 Tax=Massilia eburnea TaxID=1776165 RepID=UPI003D6B28CE
MLSFRARDAPFAFAHRAQEAEALEGLQHAGAPLIVRGSARALPDHVQEGPVALHCQAQQVLLLRRFVPVQLPAAVRAQHRAGGFGIAVVDGNGQLPDRPAETPASGAA